jgi:hypothetical protein
MFIPADVRGGYRRGGRWNGLVRSSAISSRPQNLAKEAGVEPAEHAIAHSAGFEVRAPHRDASLFHLPS